MKTRLPIPILLFLAALCLYLPGLSSQPLPGDVAVYLRRAHDLQLDSFAQTHSSFLILAHLAMRLLWWLPPALAASLLAALAAATAVALTAAILRHLGVGSAGTIFGAGALAASHTMWFHAVIPEVYSLNAAAMAAMILCALKWDKTPQASANLRRPGGNRPLLFLAAMTFLGGLACANHMLAGITLAGCWAWVGGVAWYRWQQARRSHGPESADSSSGALSLLSQGWRMAIAGLLGGLGFLPLLALLWRDAGTLGWPTVLTMALVGGRGISGEAMVSYGAAMGTLSPPQLARSATMCLGALLYNFPSPALLALPWGVGFCRRQAGGALLLGLALLHGAFAATYAIHEAWAFLLPAWMMVAIVAGLGFEGLVAAATRWAVVRQPAQGRAIAICIIAVTLLAPLVLYAAAPSLILRLAGHATIAEKAAGRRMTANAYLKFYLSPPKRQDQAEAEWLRQTLAALPDHANLCLRPGYRALAFYLQRIEFIRPDVRLLGHNTETLAAVLQAGETVFADAENPLQRLPGRKPTPLDAQLLDSGLWQIRHRR